MLFGKSIMAQTSPDGNFFVIVLCILLGIGPNGPNISTGEKRTPPRKKTLCQKPGEVSARVIGGQEATPHAFPYAVIIHVKRESGWGLCGGTLISTRYVLTAAHCLNHALEVKVFLGGHDVYGANIDPYNITMESNELTIHEEYGGTNSGKNDIGLIHLPEKVKLNESIATVELAKGNDLFAGSVGILLGWGRGTVNNTHSDMLKFTNLKIISNEECISELGNKIQEYHLCASGNGTQGACYGDSGGPLIVDCVQVGITAVVAEDCRTDKPTVFTRLTKYADWISDHAKLNKRRRRKGRGDKIAPILKVYISLIFCLVLIN